MKKLSAATLSALMALSLVGCSNKTPASSDASATDTAYMSDTDVNSIKLKDTKNLVEADSYQIKSLDYVVSALAENSAYTTNFVDGLLENDTYGNLAPALALNYDLSEDKTVYTFHLREGVKWVTRTGEEYAEVTAEDFVTGMRHGIEFDSDTAWLLQGVVKGYAEYMASGTYTDEEWAKVGVKALDDYTVEYTLENPAPYFPSMATYLVLYPINREFLESKGEGCKLGSPDKTSCQFGTSSGDSILYNGAFLLQSADEKSSTVLIKNQNYWDLENVHLDSVTKIYDDSSDPYSQIRAFEQGVYASAPLSAQWENFDQYMKRYEGFANLGLPNANAFGVIFNMNRTIFDNTNYATDEALRDNTRKAVLNENFRKAIRASFDRMAYIMVSAPEVLAKQMLRNMNNFPEIVRTSDGTAYGDLVTAAYNAISGEEPINLGDGNDPFLSKEKALAYIAEAEKEGIQFPVHLDMLVPETHKRLVEQGQSMKKSIEDNTDGKIIIELVMRDLDTVQNIAYYSSDHTESDYDISTFTGWGPDYADPKTFVDIYNPVSGNYMRSMGLSDQNSEDFGADDEIKKTVGLLEYDALYRKADKITDDLDARYKAFAEADAELVKSAFFLPSQMQTRAVRVSHVVPFSKITSDTGASREKYKGLQLQEDIVTLEQFNKALDDYNTGGTPAKLLND